MKIWLINQYNSPPEFGHLNRHFNFGKYLNRMGQEPSVFVGSSLHNTKTQMIKDDSIIVKYENSEFPYYFIKTCSYASSKLKRIYAMFEFYVNTMKSVKGFDKPDVILGSSAHPLAALAAIRLSKKYGCQSIVEVRDLWPESFVAYKFLSRNNPILRLLYAGERWIYENSDKLIFTMEGGKDYIIDRGWDLKNGGKIDLNKVHHINNGVDLEVFNYNKVHYQLDDKDLTNKDIFKVIYTGSIRQVNNVKIIVNVAFELKKMGYQNVKFLIYGDGSNRISLEKYCFENNIDNVVFKGHTDKKYIPYILCKSDLNIIHFDQNNIKKYGASLNKMFEYFASGKPIISDCRFGYDLIERYKCGITFDDTDASRFANEIVSVLNMPQHEYEKICENSLKAANDYSYDQLAKKLVLVINGGNS